MSRMERLPVGVRCCAVALLLLPVLLTACGGAIDVSARQPTASNDPMRPLTENFDAAKVAAFIGQPFPASATNVNTFGEAALDTMVIARFDLPQADLAPYLASLGVTQPLEAGYTPFASADAPYAEAKRWWTPPIDTTANIAGLYQLVGAKNFNVLVVGPDKPTVTVYLQVFNT